jgi:hypothetical protein
MWTLYDEEDSIILYVFTNREDALFKMADFEDVSTLQVAKIKRTPKTWKTENMSWKELVVDLIKRANKSIEYADAPQIAQM